MGRLFDIMRQTSRGATMKNAARIIREEQALDKGFSPKQREAIADAVEVMGTEIAAQAQTALDAYSTEMQAKYGDKETPDGA